MHATGPRIDTSTRRRLWAVAVVSLGVVVGAPLAGVPEVVRLPAVLVPAVALATLVLRPWRWSADDWDTLASWRPSSRAIWVGGLVVGGTLSWLVLSRFQSGSINAVDFTVYFDRPCYQTTFGRPLWVETADSIEYSHRSALAHHGYWAMLPICRLYAIHANPYWLLALSVFAVTLGAVYLLRAMEHLGAGGALATATALAFVLNDNTARTLNYGFHPEVLYAWFVPWFLHSGLTDRRWSLVAATVACILVKEDAVMPIFAASLALGLVGYRRMTLVGRFVCLLLPVCLALANLAVYHLVVLPHLTPGGRAVYAQFWGSYGATPMQALIGMSLHPWAVVSATVSSGLIWTVLRPHLFLPVIGWRWTLGAAPIAALLGASDDPQLRAFGLYYSIPLVPFLAIGASVGAVSLTRRVFTSEHRASLAAAAVVVLGAVVVAGSSGGYSLRPWQRQVADLPAALAELAREETVLVQSSLYPHAGYDERIQLLTAYTLTDPRNSSAVVVTAPGMGVYPLVAEEAAAVARFVPILARPSGLVVARVPMSRHHAEVGETRARSRTTPDRDPESALCAKPDGCRGVRAGTQP